MLCQRHMISLGPIGTDRRTEAGSKAKTRGENTERKQVSSLLFRLPQTGGWNRCCGENERKHSAPHGRRCRIVGDIGSFDDQDGE